MLEEMEAGSSHLVDCVSLVCLQMQWKISSLVEAVTAYKSAC